MQVACIENPEGKLVPLVDIWESYSGWYWFITEKSKIDPDDWFGLVIGFESEWGYISKSELESNKPMVWHVSKKNWFSISHVKMVEQSEIKA